MTDRNDLAAYIGRLPEREFSAIVNAVCSFLGYFDHRAYRRATQYDAQAKRLLDHLMAASSKDGEPEALRVTVDDVKVLIESLDHVVMYLTKDDFEIWIGLDFDQTRDLAKRLRELIGAESFDITDFLERVPTPTDRWPRERSMALARQLVADMPGSALHWEAGVGYEWIGVVVNDKFSGMIWLDGPLALVVPELAHDVLSLDDEYVVIGVDDLTKPMLTASNQALPRLFPGLSRVGFNLAAFPAIDVFTSMI